MISQTEDSRQVAAMHFAVLVSQQHTTDVAGSLIIIIMTRLATLRCQQQHAVMTTQHALSKIAIDRDCCLGALFFRLPLTVKAYIGNTLCIRNIRHLIPALLRRLQFVPAKGHDLKSDGWTTYRPRHWQLHRLVCSSPYLRLHQNVMCLIGELTNLSHQLHATTPTCCITLVMD